MSLQLTVARAAGWSLGLVAVRMLERMVLAVEAAEAAEIPPEGVTVWPGGIITRRRSLCLGDCCQAPA